MSSPRLVALVLVHDTCSDARAVVRAFELADAVVALCPDEALRSQLERAGAHAVVARRRLVELPDPTPRLLDELPEAVRASVAGAWVLLADSAERPSHALCSELRGRIAVASSAPSGQTTALRVPVARHLLGVWSRATRRLETRVVRLSIAPTDEEVAARAAERDAPELVAPLVSLGFRTLAELVAELDRRCARPDGGVQDPDGGDAATTGAVAGAHASAFRRLLRRLALDGGARDGVRGLIDAVFFAMEPIVRAAGRLERAAASRSSDEA